MAAVTPWAAGLGLLVSFTAAAGTGTSLGSNVPPLRSAFPISADHAGSTRIGANLLDAGPAIASPHSHLKRTDRADALLSVALSGKAMNLQAAWSHDEAAQPSLGPAIDAWGGRAAEAVLDGATPAVPRAVALSSTTPAPADATPIEVAAASLAFPRTVPSPEPEQTVPGEARHRYADLIGPDALDREQRCLAEAVYFEARSEPEEGQAAVAQVVLNRVKSGLYPTNVCGVVYQNRHRYMGCQFSFACEGKSLRITDDTSWQSASRIAKAVIEGRTYLSDVGGATHYHADYVKPGWSRRLKKMDVIGRHIFYSLKRGQT